MWWEFKDIVIYSYPYDFLQLTESLCRSLETSPNVSFLSWATQVAEGEFIKIVYLTKGVEM